MGMPLLSHAPDKNRLANIAEHCQNRKIGPIFVSPFFRNLAKDRKMEEFNCRMACFYQALLINDVKPLFVTKCDSERRFIADYLDANGSISWSLFILLDKNQTPHLSSLALATGVDRANGINYNRGIVKKAYYYFSGHDCFLLAGKRDSVEIVLPGLESYLARTGMVNKEIWAEEYLVYPPQGR